MELKKKTKNIRGTDWTKNGLQQTSDRPQTMTEKSDGGERYSSGARGATPAIMGMKKAKKNLGRLFPKRARVRRVPANGECPPG